MNDPFDPERWRRIRSFLDQAVALPEEARRAWVQDACGGDAALHADLERILAADEEAGGVLKAPTGRFLDQVIEEARQQATLTSPRDPTAAPDLGGIARHLLGHGDRAGRYLPGATIAGRYRIVALVGQGGMGDVYRADDLTLGQQVALKFLPAGADREEARTERLLNEVRLARQVAHPNVCRVHDVTEADGRWFISMEYVDGEDLASLLRRIGRLPWEKGLEIARQLCAGLAAAHAQGILHRDLKPANVMLDGRGRVRITDFGLAAAGGVVAGREARSGTPAYQAPEQIEGREATARSDLYALGVVLFEVFTGQRPFAAVTPDELRRQQEETTPTSPSSLVVGIDPAVERTILCCLEKDPAARPASAAAVAASLPGGDPLAAALAAGETPSPDLVAAAGPRGALAPRVAWSLLGAMLAAQIAIVALADHASLLGWAPAAKSADALEDDAREILRRLGHESTSADSIRFIGTADAYWGYAGFVRDRDHRPDRWQAWRRPEAHPMGLAYRQSSRLMVPVHSSGRVLGIEDPAPAAGDAFVVTDLRGVLLYLQVSPPEAEPPGEAATLPDWSALFAMAGLNLAGYVPTTPTRNPPVYADVRAAWSGQLAGYEDVPVRIEAAAYRGRPVFFEQVVPWDPYWDPGAGRSESGRMFFSRWPWFQRLALYLTLGLSSMVAPILGFRNWRRGRADRSGAIRIAGVVFFMRMTWWILGGHHVPAPWEEATLLLRAAASALWAAGVIWCFYVALEPHVRRLHPAFVIAWTRLLQGRLRDPLVGRDLLVGLLVGSLTFVVSNQINVVLPHLLGAKDPPPPLFYPGPGWFYVPYSQAILGGRDVAAALLVILLGAFTITFTLMLFLLGLRIILRSDRLALPACVAVITVFFPPVHEGGFTALSLGCALTAAVALTWTLYRLGFVAYLGLTIPLAVGFAFPITANPEAPHFGTGLVGVLFTAGLATYAAVTAIGPRPVRATEPRALERAA